MLKVKVAQSCLTLCNPMDYTVHRILQARILEWVAFLFSRGSSKHRDQTQVSRTAVGSVTSWATRGVLTYWKRPWCWEGSGAGEGDDREWDGWMASPTEWTLVWVNSRSWWWTGRTGMLRFMGLQSQTRISNWTELRIVSLFRKLKKFSFVEKPGLTMIGS